MQVTLVDGVYRKIDPDAIPHEIPDSALPDEMPDSYIISTSSDSELSSVESIKAVTKPIIPDTPMLTQTPKDSRLEPDRSRAVNHPSGIVISRGHGPGTEARSENIASDQEGLLKNSSPKLEKTRSLPIDSANHQDGGDGSSSDLLSDSESDYDSAESGTHYEYSLIGPQQPNDLPKYSAANQSRQSDGKISGIMTQNEIIYKKNNCSPTQKMRLKGYGSGSSSEFDSIVEGHVEPVHATRNKIKSPELNGVPLKTPTCIQLIRDHKFDSLDSNSESDKGHGKSSESAGESIEEPGLLATYQVSHAFCFLKKYFLFGSLFFQKTSCIFKTIYYIFILTRCCCTVILVQLLIQVYFKGTCLEHVTLY